MSTVDTSGTTGKVQATPSPKRVADDHGTQTESFQKAEPSPGIYDGRMMQQAPPAGVERRTGDRRTSEPTEPAAVQERRGTGVASASGTPGSVPAPGMQNPAIGTFSEPASLSADASTNRGSPEDLPDEASFFAKTLQQIQSAQSGDILGVQMYEFQNAVTNPTAPKATGSPGYADQEAIFQALCDASKRGVNVKLVLDASKDEKTGALNNQPIEDYLKANADPNHLSLCWYPPNEVNIDHAKELVHMRPDQQGGYEVLAAIGGGSNYGTHTPANNDGGAMFYGQDAVGAAQDFLQDQARCMGKTSQTQCPTLPADAPVTWGTTAPDSQSILAAKMKMLNECDEYYSNQFVLTQKDLVTRICQLGPKAHIVLDPSEKQYDMNAVQQMKAAGVDVKWCNVAPGQLLHRKEDIYMKNGQILGATIGSANDTANGLEQPDDPQSPFQGKTSHVTNHEIDAVITNYTSPDGKYSTLPLLQNMLAKQQQNLAAGLENPPNTGTSGPGGF